MSERQDLSIARGGEAYLRYCNGLWIAQRPEKSVELIGGHDLDSDKGRLEVVGLVEDLIQNGSRDFLEASFPADITAFQQARTRRSEVEVNGRDLLEKIVEKEKVRLDEMNEAFWRLRPAPFLHGATMTRLLHGDYDHVSTNLMLGDFAAHIALREVMYNRTLRTRTVGGTALGVSAS